MQTIKLKRKITGDNLPVWWIGDTHEGQRYHDSATFNSNVSWLNKNKDQEAVLMGDMIECAIKRFKNDQIMTIDEQIDAVCDHFSVMANEGRLWGIFQGNHEARGIEEGYNPTHRIARELNIPDLGGGAKIFYLNVKQEGKSKGRNYTVMAKHGSTGATTVTGRINNVIKMRNIINNADLYAMGHVHSRSQHHESPYNCDRGFTTLQPQTFITTGHYLLYEGSYADRKGYAPSGPSGSPRVNFHADEKRISVRL